MIKWLIGILALICMDSVMADEIATFAGGCFWCMEADFLKVPGVKSVVSGYTGGHVNNPTYAQVSAGGTGHAEAIEVTFDPDEISYQNLLNVFWKNIDPTVKDRQFCDVGDQYRSAIFYHDKAQEDLAKKSLANIKAAHSFHVETQIVAATTFYAAEDYHQKYYKKNPIRYKFYRLSCGRDKRLKQIWDADSKQ